MSLSQKLFSVAALLTLTVAAEAQGVLGGGAWTGASTIFVPSTPPILPAVQSKVGSYTRSIGNGWLGGSVDAFVAMVRQKQGTYQQGVVSTDFSGNASVLNYSREIVGLHGMAQNVMNNGVQSRSGNFRFAILGVNVINSSFSNSSTFAQGTSTFNLVPGNGVSVSVPVGPISVTIRGNAGCSFTRGANWLLPAATATVGLNANGGAHAFASASVSFGIPGFNVGVGLQGQILQQSLAINVSASSIWGLTGGATYNLQPIVLTLYAWATALWTWTTNLCSWSAGMVSLTLI